jgi:hypothetical protein
MDASKDAVAQSAAAMVEGEHEQWRIRLRERSTATLRRRAERAAAREIAARRREHGLVERQAIRLARSRSGPPSPG